MYDSFAIFLFFCQWKTPVYLSILFGHWLNVDGGLLEPRRRGWKSTAGALVADVAPAMFVRPPGTRRLQLRMELAVW